MKTLERNLARVLLVTGLLSLSIISNAQDRKTARQERNEIRKAEMKANFSILDSLLNAKSFVLEAYYLSNQYGDRIQVSPNVNFIKVNTDNGVLQTGFYNSLGYNGVGGITTEGSIGSWKVNKNFKNLTYYVQFTLHTSLGIYDISLNVTSDNHAMATITGLTPGKLIYEGQLETVGNSRVFKGNTVM